MNLNMGICRQHTPHRDCFHLAYCVTGRRNAVVNIDNLINQLGFTVKFIVSSPSLNFIKEKNGLQCVCCHKINVGKGSTPVV